MACKTTCVLHFIRWDAVRSAVAGDYIIAVGSKLLAQTRNDEVVKVLAQVLADLVRGIYYNKQHNDYIDQLYSILKIV